MRTSDKLKLLFLIAMLSVPMWPAEIALAGQEQRAPPQARTAGTLGTVVMRSITRIQEMMTPEDPDDEQDLAGAKELLDELYDRRFERMNDFEKQTTLNFYTNYYLTVEDYQEAIRTFEQLLTIETLREDTRLRTLRSLGQLYASEEEWRNSIRNYQLWRDAAPQEDDIVYRGLSYAHYQLEEFPQALPFWISFMEFRLDDEEGLDRSDYAYLNSLYFIIEDFPSALQVTKSMIMLYDEATDWLNLSAIYAGLDDEERRVRSLNLAFLKGHIEDDTRFLNLGQSMAGIDIPLSGGKIIQHGVDLDAIELDEGNLRIITQLLLLGSAYENALEPAQMLAEVSENGDGYDTLGYINYVLHDYEAAADAFQAALDKGDLDDRADTLLFLSRSLLELDDFEGALSAARQAADAGERSSDRDTANTYRTFIASTKTRFDALAAGRANAIDFYETYPPLQ